MFKSIAEWLEYAAERGATLPEAVQAREAHNTETDPADIRARISETLTVMRAAIEEGLASDEESPTRMTGGRGAGRDGRGRAEDGRPVSGDGSGGPDRHADRPADCRSRWYARACPASENGSYEGR